MKVLITYFTVTGNTAEIAHAMAEQTLAMGHAVDIKPVADVLVTDFDGYDIVFVGSACHDTSLAKPVLSLLNEMPASPSYMLAGFATHSTVMPDHPVHGHLYGWAGKCLPAFESVCKDKGITFKGYFHCMGRPSDAIAQFIHNDIIPDEAEWTDYYADVMTHPDAQDIADAKAFIEGLLA